MATEELRKDLKEAIEKENVNNAELPTVVRELLFDKILSGLKKFFKW